VPGFVSGCGNLDSEVGRTGIDQIDAVARRQDELALGTGDEAGVGGGVADQVDIAAGSCADVAVVDDAVTHPVGKLHAPGNEVGVGQIEGTADQTTHVDPAAGTEQDAVGVDEEDAAVALQGAEDG